ncbi:MAG: Mur ligase family protein [Patescibacteria group bacterium]|nr:Mur ligase family protein [Patescibacteria group bacterium]
MKDRIINMRNKFRNSPLYARFRKWLPNDLLNYFYHFPVALAAAIWYRYPAKDLIVVGVTGTSGKTTTTHLIFNILKEAGFSVSMISTVKAVIGTEVYDTGLHVTNPEPFLLQKLINQARISGSKYLVLEMTSHGLTQFRNFGINLMIGIITNVTHEHLDYHRTMKNYVLAKAKILHNVKYSILNKDDKNFRILKNLSFGRLVTFSLKKRADFNLKTFPFTTKLPGIYNKYNCLSAIAAAKMLGINDDVIRAGLQKFPGIPGRMEEVKTGKNFRVFIDFAHKPDAIKNVLETARKKTKKRVIIVFGSAGLRDRTKRPVMGEIAGRLADISVLTAEDPRTEKVNSIINQIARGAKKAEAVEVTTRNYRVKLKKGRLYNYSSNEVRSSRSTTSNNNFHYFIRIPDRRKAIRLTIRKLAQKGDLLLFCGKGHEKSMCYGTTEFPWNEKEEITKALDKINNRHSGKRSASRIQKKMILDKPE